MIESLYMELRLVETESHGAKSSAGFLKKNYREELTMVDIDDMIEHMIAKRNKLKSKAHMKDLVDAAVKSPSGFYPYLLGWLEADQLESMSRAAETWLEVYASEKLEEINKEHLQPSPTKV